MQVSLLGPVRVRADGGAPIDVGGARLRMLLARLALDAGRPVSTESLVAGLWDTEPPADAANALQSLVSRLRKALGDGGTLASVNGGYALQVSPSDVDAHRFEELAALGRHELTAGRYAGASAALAEALGLWRGAALTDVLDAPFAQPPATRLEDLRAAAAEDRFEAELELGRHAEVLADLEAAGAAYPLRERLAGLRMRALYAAGRQSDALTVYERTRATLAEELGVDPAAELQQVHLAVLRGELAKPVVPRPETLPVRLTSFVGREKELDRLAESLTAARLVTLVGPGGAGKTRLATETAVRHPAHERGRVWFVALAGVRDAGDVTGAILGALGSLDIRLLSTQTMTQTVDALDRITDVLYGGESLLVLDNCEHLVGAAAELAHELLTRVPDLRILATSREPLAITGEALCQLGPLEVPEAMRLFTERAAGVRPGFALNETTRDPVAEICHRLDGMPLALELAAARLRSMSVEQITQRLDDRFRLLTSGSRVALPRQRTLRAVVEWSWDLLEKPERVLARRLSVFPSGATLSAAEAICADELLPAEDVLYVLSSLAEKSIVDVTGSGPRYRMLETLRAYGDERLDEAGERDAVTHRFSAYFLRMAEENEPSLRTRDQLHAIETFEAEHDNMVTALRRAIDTGDADTAYRFVESLMWYWVIRGFNDQATEFVGDLIQFKGRIPEHAHAAFSAVHTVLRGMPSVDEKFRELVDECARTDAMSHYPMLALALPMLSFMARAPRVAVRELRRALAHPDPWARAAAHWVVGFIRGDRGDLEGSERARDLALQEFEEIGDRWGIAMTLAMRAEVYSLRGDHERAIAGFTRGLELARELASPDDITQQLCRLAEERMRVGDIEGAWWDVREAERVAAETRETRYEAVVKFTMLELARRSGDFEQAHRMLDWLNSWASRSPFPANMADEFAYLARSSLLVSEGKAAEARAVLPTVLRSSAGRNDMPDAAKAVQVAARLFSLEGRAEAAAWTLGASQVLRGTFDSGDPELRALVADLTAELGEQPYQEAYRRGASLPKPEATRLLLAEFGEDAGK